jgi:hypothetical protein
VVSTPVFHGGRTIVVVEYEIRRFGFVMRYECGITIIRKKATKESVISGNPLECVSRRKRVTSTVGKIADMSVGNVVRLEDTIGCLTGWRKEVGQKRGVDKPLVQRLPENRTKEYGAHQRP